MHVGDMRLDEIDPDDRFLISCPRLPGRYEGATERFPGLPLLIIDVEKRIVSGHDYLLLLRGQGRVCAPVLQTAITLAEGLVLNFNLQERLFGLNLCEKLLFIRKIAPLLPRPEIQRRAQLGFPLNEPLQRSLGVLLSGPFCACLAAGRLGLRTALKLAGQGEADRLAQIGIFQACGFSESQQWQISQLLEELAFREKQPLADWLAASGLPALLAGEMPQKKFMDALGALRYPALARREKEWRDWQGRTTPREGLAVRHAPLFASEEVQVTLNLANRAAVEKLLRWLKKTLAH